MLEGKLVLAAQKTPTHSLPHLFQLSFLSPREDAASPRITLPWALS